MAIISALKQREAASKKMSETYKSSSTKSDAADTSIEMQPQTTLEDSTGYELQDESMS